MKRCVAAMGILVTLVCVSREVRAGLTSCGTTGLTSPCIGGDNTSSSGYAVVGESAGGIGVYGTDTASGYGMYASSSSGDGIYADGGNTGVTGNGTSIGVYGYSSSGNGVFGQSSSLNGVEGKTSGSGASAVYAENDGGGYGAYGRITPYGAGYAVYGDNNSNASGAWAGYFNGAVKVTGELTVGSCSGCTSDIRLKKDVKPLEGAIDELLQLRGVTFSWKAPSEHGGDDSVQHGFIAQDVEKVFPKWVHEDGYTAPDGQKYKTLDVHQIEALEVESIRTLKAENQALNMRLTALENSRRQVSTMGGNGAGIGIAGLALAGAFVFARRKRDEAKS